MLRFFARFVGFWLVATAVVFAVVDGAKTIAASSLVTTSVAETWAMISTSAAANPAEPSTLPWPLDLAAAWLMAAPSVAVLAVLGVAFLILGAKKRRPLLSREYAA